MLGGSCDAGGRSAARAAKSPLGASTAYNGMIAPLQPFAIKGVIYYREIQRRAQTGISSAATRPDPKLAQGVGRRRVSVPIRAAPGFGEHKAEKDKRLDMPPAALAALHQPGSESALGRAAQSVPPRPRTYRTRAWPSRSIWVMRDIHPKNKVPVGERLALAAHFVAYGEKLVHSGPIFQSLTSNGSNVVLHFTEIGGGLVARGGRLSRVSRLGQQRWHLCVCRRRNS